MPKTTIVKPPKLTAGEQRLVDATVEISRLALYLDLAPVELRAALYECGLLVTKDAKHLIAQHQAIWPDWEQVK
jgi:hypothetical protein